MGLSKVISVFCLCPLSGCAKQSLCCSFHPCQVIPILIINCAYFHKPVLIKYGNYVIKMFNIFTMSDIGTFYHDKSFETEPW